MSDRFSLDFFYAYEQPKVSALFRRQPEDFLVDEVLGFSPSGEGEHVYLHIKKRSENTAWVVKQIAQLAEVRPMDVGYCGLKDRHAVTTQWFSIYLPGKTGEPKPSYDWSLLNSETIEVLSYSRHTKKLRRGQHLYNSFSIRLYDLSGAIDDNKLQKIADQGVPNYFGEQRFGREGGNLPLADEMLTQRRTIKNRQQRGLILSAARSYLFNLVLSERVKQGNWTAELDGEVAAGATKNSGPLWGRGRTLVQSDVAELEEDVLTDWLAWRDALEHRGLTQERRALVLLPEKMAWTYSPAEQCFEIAFRLPPGAYATSLLREITQLKDVSAEGRE